MLVKVHVLIQRVWCKGKSSLKRVKVLSCLYPLSPVTPVPPTRPPGPGGGRGTPTAPGPEATRVVQASKHYSLGEIMRFFQRGDLFKPSVFFNGAIYCIQQLRAYVGFSTGRFIIIFLNVFRCGVDRAHLAPGGGRPSKVNNTFGCGCLDLQQFVHILWGGASDPQRPRVCKEHILALGGWGLGWAITLEGRPPPGARCCHDPRAMILSAVYSIRHHETAA